MLATGKHAGDWHRAKPAAERVIVGVDDTLEGMGRGRRGLGGGLGVSALLALRSLPHEVGVGLGSEWGEE